MSGIKGGAATEVTRRRPGDRPEDPQLEPAEVSIVSATDQAADEFSVEWQIVLEPEAVR